ncbi:EamA family transporter [Aquicoccus sp. SU-CL01552]|uniref:EamA family transporter n=1 Tax=Aquicoccus sp. SU-CL01552 TaxID=3127656 RepID=UPI003101C459
MAATWQFWALLAAIFAAMTAIFAKLGVAEVNSDFATFLRTLVVIAVLAAILWLRSGFEPLSAISPKGALFLVLSGLATGASWLCYFRALKLGKVSQVAPVDKLSVVFVALIAAVFLGEQMSVGGWTGVALIATGAVMLAVF